MTHIESVRELASILNPENEARPTILLGAGASFSSGVPLADEAVKRMAKRVFSERILGGKVVPEQVKTSEWRAWLNQQTWFINDDSRLADNFPLAVKATVHKYDNAVPIQILRRSTIDRDDDAGHSQATRNWNFATALYYKSGGMPWRPSDLPEGVCFVGVSFHHLKKRGGHLVYASVAQAFSSDHEPFCLKGAHIDHEQRIDRQPYLNESQAYSMMRDILDGYEKRTGVKPKRVVVHKTSTYQAEEEKGFRDAARGVVPGCDLVWLRQTPFRLVRKGSEEPWRGTLCRIAGEAYLFTSGYVPWWDEFPGAHIPAPIQIGSAGDTDIEERAREILTLSKMNWNSSDGITRMPVTLLFAKRVGEIMTELSDNVSPNPSFRFHT